MTNQQQPKDDDIHSTRPPPAPQPPISSRGKAMLAPATPYLGHHFAALSNLWCPISRPEGIVTLAVAENKLSYELLHERLPALQALPREVAQYEDMKGMPSFREALGSFLGKYVFNAEAGGWAVDPAQLCVSAGVGSLVNHLGLALFEAGDAVLIPSPSYASFVFDLKVLANVECLGVPLSTHGYRLTREDLGAALSTYRSQGKRIRGIIITNPQNPLGIIYSEEELRMVIDWAAKENLHLISDEIYALSVFGPVDGCEADGPLPTSTGFKSVAELLNGQLGPNVHVLWGFSKDFGISGFRCGVLYSQNEELQQALSSVSYFCAVSNPIQAALSELITDEKWLGTYIQENARRLRAACSLCCQALSELGVPYIRPQAGMFLWIDLSAYLPKEGEGVREGGWEDEFNLFVAMKEEVGLVLTPGQSQSAPYPGCFRVCYAFFASMEALEEGMKRLKRFLQARKKATTDVLAS